MGHAASAKSETTGGQACNGDAGLHTDQVFAQDLIWAIHVKVMGLVQLRDVHPTGLRDPKRPARVPGGKRLQVVPLTVHHPQLRRVRRRQGVGRARCRVVCGLSREPCVPPARHCAAEGGASMGSVTNQTAAPSSNSGGRQLAPALRRRRFSSSSLQQAAAPMQAHASAPWPPGGHQSHHTST
jgi:hypothetical protein